MVLMPSAYLSKRSQRSAGAPFSFAIFWLLPYLGWLLARRSEQPIQLVLDAVQPFQLLLDPIQTLLEVLQHLLQAVDPVARPTTSPAIWVVSEAVGSRRLPKNCSEARRKMPS